MPFVERERVRIHYELRGTGPAILFHTGAGGDARIWESAGYVDGLSGFRRILVDQRGRGQSGRPGSIEDHRMEHYVSDVEAVLDDAGVEAAAFWGYSNGVLVGLAFGTAHPGRMKALLGVGSLPDLDLVDRGPIADPEAFVREQVARGGVAQDVDAFMREEGDRFPEAIDRNVRAGDPRMYALDRIAWRSWKGPKSLYASFPTPVLMFSGEREDKERTTEICVRAMPTARLIRVPGVGHLSAFARSDLSLPHAIPFLRDHLG